MPLNPTTLWPTLWSTFRRTTLWSWLCLVLLLACGTRAARAEDADTNRVSEDWQVMAIDGERVGYAHTEIRAVRNSPEGLLHGLQESEMTFQRFGQEIKLQTTLRTVETETGDLRSFEFELRNPPAQPTRNKGTVEGNRMRLELDVAGRTTTRLIDWSPGTKSPLFQERVLHNLRIGAGQSRSFECWQPELSRVGTIRIRADERRSTALWDGRDARLMKYTLENSAVPTLNTRAFADEKGFWQKTETDFFGKTLTTFLVPETEALKAITGAELDLALLTSVRVEGLRDPHRDHEVVYKIKLKDDDPARYFADGVNQTVSRIDNNTIKLTVRKLSPPPQTAVRRKTDAEYLAKTDFLQSDNYRVREMAQQAAGYEQDPWRAALAMERMVFQRVKTKNFSTALASAAEVAEKLEGDCTEHAMLLAAMLRAQKIPSRVCVGLVHAGQLSGFAGHMWTEAWIRDRWMPLDATFGRGGIGCGHIKLTDSSLGENAPAPVMSFLPLMKVLGKLEIEALSAR